MTSTGKSLGYAYIATRQCGRVSGLAWEDVTSERDAALLVREWTQRGDNVQLIERFEGDPMPEWVCRGEPCECETERAQPLPPEGATT